MVEEAEIGEVGTIIKGQPELEIKDLMKRDEAVGRIVFVKMDEDDYWRIDIVGGRLEINRENKAGDTKAFRNSLSASGEHMIIEADERLRRGIILK